MIAHGASLLTAEDLTFSRPAGYCFDWQVLIYNQRTPVPEPDLFYRCLTSLPKVIVFFKNEILIKICLKNMRSKWLSFGSNCLWMYGAPPVRDRLSFATHWTILVFFHNIFFCSLVQVVKQFWSVSDIQDMDFARFATIQNFLNIYAYYCKKKMCKIWKCRLSYPKYDVILT